MLFPVLNITNTDSGLARHSIPISGDHVYQNGGSTSSTKTIWTPTYFQWMTILRTIFWRINN